MICYDPFHVIKLAGDALDAVRRQVWQSARRFPDKTIANRYKGARWALLKNPGDLTEEQAETLAGLRKSGGALWRAYQLKETLPAVFAGDLESPAVMELLDRWCSRAQRPRLPEFVKCARTIRAHNAGITAAVDRELTNGRHERLNNKVRTMINRAYGFHSAQAAPALIMLACGPVKLELPYHIRTSTFMAIEPNFPPCIPGLAKKGQSLAHIGKGLINTTQVLQNRCPLNQAPGGGRAVEIRR